MDSRSDADETSENENASVDLKNDEFVKLLEGNSILFHKSHSPGVQKKKNKCLEHIQRSYFEKTNKSISAQQVRKRICNMKSEVRKYLRNDFHRKLKPLKEWHKLVMKFMDEHGDLMLDDVAEIPTSTLKMENQSDGENTLNMNENFINGTTPDDAAHVKSYELTTLTSTYERLGNEPEETRNLSNIDLERAVLLAKYELIALQTQLAKEQLEFIALQKNHFQRENQS